MAPTFFLFLRGGSLGGRTDSPRVRDLTDVEGRYCPPKDLRSRRSAGPTEAASGEKTASPPRHRPRLARSPEATIDAVLQLLDQARPVCRWATGWGEGAKALFPGADVSSGGWRSLAARKGAKDHGETQCAC